MKRTILFFIFNFSFLISFTQSIWTKEKANNWYKDQPWFLNQVLKVRPTSRLTLSDDRELTGVMTNALAETPEIFAPFLDH